MKNHATPIGILLALSLLFAACSAPPPATAPLAAPTTPPIVAPSPVAPTVAPQPATAQPAATSAAAAPSEPAVEAPTQLDVARITIPSKLNHLDPVKAAVVADIQTQYLVYGRLYRLNLDWTVYPELAENLPQVSEDGLTVTVLLKKGLTYSDSTPIVAGDAVYAFERQRDEKGVLAFLLPPIKAVEAPDDNTIVFKLNHPYRNLPFAMASMAMPLNPVAKAAADPKYYEHPVFSGQYVVQQWIPGASEFTLAENPNYALGPSMIKSLVFVHVPDLTSRALQLTTGQVQFAIDLPNVVASVKLPAEINVASYPTFGGYNLSFNLGLPDSHPLMNRDVRHAISLAIDRQQIADAAFFGTVAPLSGYLSSDIAESIAVFPNDGKRDVEGAKTLLAGTPFAKDAKFTLQVWNRPSWPDAALIIKNNLADIGLNVEVQTVEDAVGLANLRAGTYEAMFASNVQEPLTLLQNQFLSTSAWGGWTRYNNPKVDQLLGDATKALTQDERVRLAQEAQKIAYEDMPNTAITQRITLMGSRLGSLVFPANTPPGVYIGVQLVKDANK